jgi:hypothetical protein
VRYGFIKRHEQEHSVRRMCKVMLTCPLQPYQSVGERSKGLQVN